MTIYVQSRGKSQEHDHCWLEVTKDHQSSVMPPVLKEIKPEELIDSQKQSIILARSGEYLVLLVMSLKAGDERLDFMGRQIYNSVAWVEKELPNKENHLRKIAIQALNEELADLIDKAVENNADSKYGFRADFNKLKSIGDASYDEGIVSTGVNSNRRVGKDNKALRADLIKELAEHTLPTLPDVVQILVVVTTIKSEDGLKRKGAWRGLSSRIESKDWLEYDVSKDENLDSHKDKKKLIAVIAIALLAGVVAIAIWMIHHHSAPQNLQPNVPVQPIETNTTLQTTSEISQ